jgi:hypothetical protein
MHIYENIYKHTYVYEKIKYKYKCVCIFRGGKGVPINYAAGEKNLMLIIIERICTYICTYMHVYMHIYKYVYIP